MSAYLVTFRHLSWGTPVTQFTEAHNPQAAIARAARAARLQCKRKGWSWHVWHTDNGVQCYSVAKVVPL
jgi:hypothetical protein